MIYGKLETKKITSLRSIYTIKCADPRIWFVNNKTRIVWKLDLKHLSKGYRKILRERLFYAITLRLLYVTSAEWRTIVENENLWEKNVKIIFMIYMKITMIM